MNVRKYGTPPYNVVVVHGGPGAPGEMAPVARELSSLRGILEPLQTETTVEGQIEELKTQTGSNCRSPAVFIGYSWGAWLSYLVAARYPDLVQKLILVSSGPFDAKYVPELKERRRSRLNAAEREELDSLIGNFSGLDDSSLRRLSNLTNKTDLYDPAEHQSEVLKCDSKSFNGVWPEAASLRESGWLLAQAKDIRCPVLAIHGEFDPHPPRGVELPLKERLSNFRFVELKYCGHTPWIERQAREEFYRLLKMEI